MNILKKIVFYIAGPKKVFTICEKYLNSGTYVISDDFSEILLNDEKINKNTETFSSIASSVGIKKIIEQRLARRKKLIKKNFNNQFCGEKILISSSKKEYKIFDYKNSKILTIYQSKEKYNKIKNNISYISSILKTPPITEYDDKNNIIIEELINSNKISKVEEKYNKIFEEYIKNSNKFKKIYENKKTKSPLDKYKIMRNISKNLEGEIEKIFSTKILSHGDLWSSNILETVDSMYYIDLENVNFYPFIYDLLFFIFSEAYIKNDYTLIESYLNGKYDNYLDKYFNNFGFKYRKEEKDKYLYSFIYCYAINKWKQLPKYKLKREIKKLETFIDFIEKEKGESK